MAAGRGGRGKMDSGTGQNFKWVVFVGSRSERVTDISLTSLVKTFLADTLTFSWPVCYS